MHTPLRANLIPIDRKWDPFAHIERKEEIGYSPAYYAAQIMDPAILPRWPKWGSVGKDSSQWITTLDGECYLLTAYQETLHTERRQKWSLTVQRAIVRRPGQPGQSVTFEPMFREFRMGWWEFRRQLRFVVTRLQAWEAERAL